MYIYLGGIAYKSRKGQLHLPLSKKYCYDKMSFKFLLNAGSLS